MTQHGASEDTQVFAAGRGAGDEGPSSDLSGPPPGSGGPQRLVVHDNTQATRNARGTGVSAAEDQDVRGGSADESEPVAEPAAAPRDRSRVRRARLRTIRVDPWSVMKTAFLLSIAFGIMTLVAVAVVWNVLEAAGVYESVNSTISEVLGTGTDQGFNLYDYIGLRQVMGIAALIAVVDVVLITALATLGAFLYNLSASLLGGVELTLAEDE